MGTPALGGHQQDANLVLTEYHTAIHSNIVLPGFRVHRYHPTPGIDIPPPVKGMPLGNRNLEQVYIVAFDNVLLHRASADLNRWHWRLEPLSQQLGKVAGRSIFRHIHHQGKPTPLAQSTDELPPAPGVFVAFDVFKQQRRTTLGIYSLDNSRQFTIPVHSGFDSF